MLLLLVAQASDGCEGVPEVSPTAEAMGLNPVLVEQKYTEQLVTCSDPRKRAILRLARGKARLLLRRYFAAVDDFELAMADGDRCAALYGEIRAWLCVDSALADGKSCLAGPFPLPAPGKTKPYSFTTAKALAAMNVYRIECGTRDTMDWTLWQSARLQRAYGQTDQLERTLCSLLRDFPKSPLARRAASFLAETHAICVER